MRYRRQTIILVALILSISGIYVWKSRGIPFTAKRTGWSIGIYTGENPYSLKSPANINNPVLTAEDVSDVNARFVADPFMLYEKNTWYMFFEVLNKQTNQGDIALAMSDDGFSWTYKKIVIDEDFHVTFPYVFKWQNEYYMVPESHQAKSVRLYKAVDFPTEWEFIGNLLEGGRYVDSAIVHYKDKWWLFTTTSWQHDDLRLYYADNLLGPWIEHPQSPVIKGDANIARPGGRPIIVNGNIVRYTQDCDPTYGNQVRAFEITELTTKSYKEKKVVAPILKGTGSGWNGRGMHHIDPHQIAGNKWIAAVDGSGKRIVMGLDY